ncbi:MAG: zinc-binding dehydrogenase [Azospirillaceae bacterium]|nr:zinc-binding dehydrogenase [Azospirillaceae bacterium]
MTAATMRAALLRTQGQKLELRSDIGFAAPGRGQVLVRVAFSGVCHSQLMEVRGGRGPDAWLPHLLGHEGSGIVQAIGAGVTKVVPGDRVILGWIKGSGLEAGGAHYQCGDTRINAGGVTTFNEYALVSENRLTPLPDDIPMDIAVLFGCAVPTGAGIVLNELQPPPGSTIGVFGLGGIGMSALMATALCDAARVIAVDRVPEKLALAREFGATDLIDAGDSDVLAAIRALTGGRGLDFAVEASGQVRVIEQAFAAVRPQGGLCVFASHPRQGERIALDPYDLICGRQIRGSWGGRCVPDRDIPRFLDLYRQGRLPLEKLITRRYRLDQINEALDDLEAGRVGRPLIEIAPDLASGIPVSVTISG